MKHWLIIFLIVFTSPAFSDLRLDKTALGGISETSLLWIQGINLSNTDVILIIRGDDTQNPRYAERANIERVIPSGKFELLVPLARLRTPGGRQLKLSNLQQIILFPGKPRQGFSIISADIKTPKPLGENIYAWDLGPSGSAIWPGFIPLTIDSRMLKGKGLNPIDRSAKMHAADSLTIDGIRGIDTVSLPLPAGEWQITLWLRDAGEWEYLPHPLQREIYANNQRVYFQNFSPKEWIEHVYLGRRDIHVSPDSSSWTHFGERISDRVTFNVASNGDPVMLRLQGNSTDAQFISAILAIPSNKPNILDMLTRQRKAWWEKTWPITNWRHWPTGHPSLKALTDTIYAAPGTSALATFTFEQGNIPGAPIVIVKKPAFVTQDISLENSLNNKTPLIGEQGKQLVSNKMTLAVHSHWSQWHLTRTHLSSTLLKASNTYLRHGLMPENTGVSMPRKVIVRIDIPKSAPAGKYQGELNILIKDKNFSTPFNVVVVPAILPELIKPVGIYLEKPVHFGWFETLAHLGVQTMICDLTFLRKLGLTGISPPYPTPHNNELREEFDMLSMTLNKMGFTGSMAYAPVKRLSQALGARKAANVIAQLEIQHKKRLQNAPYWSIADEPSNPGHIDLFKEIYRNLSMFAPMAKLAGHLNHKDDNVYLSMFDMILINDGFGADIHEIRDAQKNKREVWLYNMPNPRAAAGFYLWHSNADGFLQWHGRMPTADPFDPTDGREVDVQFLYPSDNPCPEEPDIDIALYEIMEGIVDHRWLLWLTHKARSNNNALLLLNKLRRQIPNEWKDMKQIDATQLGEWRQQIINLSL